MNSPHLHPHLPSCSTTTTIIFPLLLLILLLLLPTDFNYYLTISHSSIPPNVLLPLTPCKYLFWKYTFISFHSIRYCSTKCILFSSILRGAIYTPTLYTYIYEKQPSYPSNITLTSVHIPFFTSSTSSTFPSTTSATSTSAASSSYTRVVALWSSHANKLTLYNPPRPSYPSPSLPFLV